MSALDFISSGPRWLRNWYHSSMQHRTGVHSPYHFLLDFVRDEDGGPLIEFTILMPIFFIIILGIIEWGNIFFVKNNMLIAAREGARSWAVGTVTSTSTAMKNTCKSPFLTGTNYVYTLTFSTWVGCTATYNGTNPPPPYGLVTMQVTTPAVPVSVFNYLGSVTGLTLSASATLQEEFVCQGAAPSASSCVCGSTC